MRSEKVSTFLNFLLVLEYSRLLIISQFTVSLTLLTFFHTPLGIMIHMILDHDTQSLDQNLLKFK